MPRLPRSHRFNIFWEGSDGGNPRSDISLEEFGRMVARIEDWDTEFKEKMEALLAKAKWEG
jgi:hypothetical protein